MSACLSKVGSQNEKSYGVNGASLDLFDPECARTELSAYLLKINPAGATALLFSSSRMPHCSNSRVALGGRCIPAPVGDSSLARSSMMTLCPCLASAMLAHRPAIPAPHTMMVKLPAMLCVLSCDECPFKNIK